MPFPYNFSKVKEPSFEPLAPGWYPFRVAEASEQTSKSGHPMVKTVLECLDPSNKGKKVWHYVTFLPEDAKGSGISKHFMKCMGFDVETIRNVDAYEWVGKTIMGKVSIEEYNGNRNNKIVEVSPVKDDSVKADEIPF